MPFIDINEVKFDDPKDKTKPYSADESGTYDELIASAANQYNIDPFLIRSVVKSESNFDPKATSEAGAQGLMQIMPGTAKDLGITSPYDPVQNVMGGTQYLAQQLQRFKGDVAKAVAAYNAGPSNIRSAQNRYGDQWLENLHEITGEHADETRSYVDKVQGFYKTFKQPVEEPKKSVGNFVDASKITFDDESPLPDDVAISDVTDIGMPSPELPATLIGGFVTAPIGGLAGLGTLLYGGMEDIPGMPGGAPVEGFDTLKAAAEVTEKIAGMPFEGISEQSKKDIASLMTPMRWIDEAADKGGQWAASWGGATVGATVKTTLQYLAYFGLPVLAKGFIGKIGKINAEMAKGLNVMEAGRLIDESVNSVMQNPTLVAKLRALDELAGVNKAKAKGKALGEETKAKARELSQKEKDNLATINDFRKRSGLDPIDESVIRARKEREIARKQRIGKEKTEAFRKEKGLPPNEKKIPETKEIPAQEKPVGVPAEAKFTPTEKAKSPTIKETLKSERGSVGADRTTIAKQTANQVNKEIAGLVKYDGEWEVGKGDSLSQFTTHADFGKLPKGQTFAIKGEPTLTKVKEALIRKAQQYKVEPGTFKETVKQPYINKKGGIIPVEAQDNFRFNTSNKTDLARVNRYREQLRQGKELEPILADINDKTGEVFISDGHHRALAAQLEGKPIKFERSEVLGERTPEGTFERNPKNWSKSPVETAGIIERLKKINTVVGERGSFSNEIKQKYAGSINLTKQSISDAAKKVEIEMLEKAGKGNKPSVTHVEQIEVAKKILTDWQKNPKEWAKAIKRIQAGKTPSIAEEVAHRMLNADNFETFREVAKAFSEGELTQEQFNNYQTALRTQALNVVDPLASEAGRRLGAYNIEVGKFRAQKAIAELNKGMNDRQLKAFLEVNWEDKGEVNAFIHQLPNPALRDYIYEFLYNSILSSVPIHFKNIMSTASWIAWQLPHRAGAALIDLGLSPFTKQRNYYLNELGPMAKGYAKGFVGGAKAAKQTMITGKLAEFETKWAQELGASIGAWERSPYKIMRDISPYLRPPTNALRAMDIWMRAAAYDGELSAFARRIANKRGLKGEARAVFERDFKMNPSKEALESAGKFAKYSIFMDDPGVIAQSIIQLRSKIPGGRLVVPFVNTIGNIIKRGAEMTPGLGIALSRGQKLPDIIAKQIEGTLIALMVMSKLESGEMTGLVPDQPAKRDAFYRAKKQPLSIKVGDRMVQMNVEPFNIVMQAAAIAHKKLTEENDEATKTQIFTSFANDVKEMLLDSSYLSQVTYLTGPSGKQKNPIDTFVKKTSTNFIPYSGLMGNIAEVYESLVSESGLTVKEKQKWTDFFMNKIPVASTKIDKKINVWGKEIVLADNFLYKWLPYKISKPTNDPVEAALEKLNVYPQVPEKSAKFADKELTFDEDIYRDMSIRIGREVYEQFSKTVQNRDFKKQLDKSEGDIHIKANLVRYLESLHNKVRKNFRERAIGMQLKRNQQR